MWQVCFTIQILIYHYTVECRKYDLDSESMKLYGEGLNTVLKRFRKTPEYMNILNDKVADLKQNFEDMIGQLTFVHQMKLEAKINETIASLDKDKNKGDSRSWGVLRRQANPEDSPDGNNQTTTLSPVETLDSHPSLKLPLTVSEKNFYKDMGFEFAGNAIHSMLQNMGNGNIEDCEKPKSTRMDGNTVKDKSTTEHVHVHEVTSPKEEGKMETTKPSYKQRAELEKFLQ